MLRSEERPRMSGRSKPPDETFFSLNSTNISAMTNITFTQDDLAICVDQLSKGRHKATGQANARYANEFVWPISNGIINRDIVNEILDRLYAHYPSYSSRDKANLFVKNFLEFLEDEKGYDLKKYLKIVKGCKPKRTRALNKFNLDDHDILNLINHIKEKQAHLADPQQATTQALFLAFTGMRQETSDRLKVKDIKNALNLTPSPSLLINSEIDKTDTEHYVPLHPILIPLLTQLITDRNDEEKIFDSIRLATFLRNHPVPCIDKQTGNFMVKFLRKFFTQKSDKIGLDSDVSDYIQSHNLNSVTWRSYKHYTYDEIYNKYITSWGPVVLCPNSSPLTEVDILADIDFDKLYTEPPAPKTEESLLKQIESSLDSIKMNREFIRYLNTLVPPDQRLKVDEFLPTASVVRERIIIRLETYEGVIETEEDYNRTFLEQLRKEADYYNDLMLDEERRYYKFRASV